MMPSVDIILPVYNGADLLPYALESILAQTHEDWRCYLVDDGSEDDTLEVMRSYVAEDKRFSLLSLPHVGISKALNAGLAAGSSSIIARLDADDMWHPKHLECCLKALEIYEVDFVGTTIVPFIEHLTFSFPVLSQDLSVSMSSQDVYDYLLVGNPIAHPTVVFNRCLLANLPDIYQSQYDGLEDFDLWCRIMTPTNSMILNLPTVAYNFSKPRDFSKIYPRVASRIVRLRQQRGLTRQEHDVIKERFR